MILYLKDAQSASVSPVIEYKHCYDWNQFLEFWKNLSECKIQEKYF